MVSGIREYSPHQIGLLERGAKKIIPAGFPGDGVIEILFIKSQRGLGGYILSVAGLAPGWHNPRPVVAQKPDSYAPLPVRGNSFLEGKR